MDMNAKAEIAKAILAINEDLQTSYDPDKPMNSTRDAVRRICKNDADLCGFLELAMYWPDDCRIWAEAILAKRPSLIQRLVS
jgi:hypothetical protein